MRQRNFAVRKHQQGLTLVELMISLVLGLVVVSAVLNTFMGSSRSAGFSQGLQQLQENGRYGITTLQRAIRLAGFSPSGDIVDRFDIANSGNSTISVRVTDVYDCNGQSTVDYGGIAVNTYAHDSATSSITCTGNASVTPTAMQVVEGVEAMRFLWGIDSDADGVPESYIPYAATIDSSQVVAIRVALLVGTDEPIRSRASAETHVLFDFETPETNDKIARHVFTATVVASQQSRTRTVGDLP